MTEKRASYTIGIQSEGLENLTKLSSGLDGASQEAAQLKKEAAEVAAQLAAVGQQQQAVDNLRDLSEQSRKLGNDLGRSAAEVERLGAQLPEAAKKTGELSNAQQKAAQEVQDTRQAIGEMQQALKTLRTESDAATRGTDEYKASAGQARTTIAELGAQLVAKREALTQATAASRTAADEERALQRSYDQATTSAERTSAALGAKRRALQDAKGLAKELGLDTSSLAAAQEQVNTSSRLAQQGLDGVSDSLRRVQQRQEQAAQTTAQLQQDLRRLGLDGRQAPAGLEAAFKKLGMDGVDKTTRAIHELQAALAQVRNSPDVLPADKEAAVQGYRKAVAELRQETAAATTATTGLGQAADSTGTSLDGFAKKAVAVAAGMVALDQIRDVASGVVETGSAFENLEVRLGNLLGAAEDAQATMGMLKDMAASTPFDVQGLSEAFVQLTSFGLKPTEAQMRSLVDIAANLGGGTDKLSGVALALGQAWTKTKLQGEEILQLAERGVPVWDALARATGRTVPELQRMSEAGLLGRDVIAKLIDELGRMNAGASDRLMNTYAGAVANASDALQEFYAMVAKAGVLDWLTDKIRGLLAEFDRMKESGELEQKAKQIADAFVQVATMAETATEALVYMAPVIEKTVKIFLALKAVNLATSLWASVFAARAVAPAIAAAGAASAVSTGQMAAASRAAGALATSLRLVRSLTGIGLVIGAAELAAEFFRAKSEAEAAERAVAEMLAPQPVNGPKQAADEASNSLDQVARKSNDILAKFAKMQEDGTATADVLRKIGSDFDLSTSEGIGTAAQVLEALVEKSAITATQFNDTWAQALQGVDLLGFEVRARQALEGTEDSAAKLASALDAGLRESIRRAGGDFELLEGGMGKAAQSAVGDVDFLIGNLDRLRARGMDTSRALSQSLGKAIDTADGQAAMEALRVRIEAVRNVLGDKLADGLLDQAANKIRDLQLAADGAVPGIQSVEEAMRRLGVASDQSLKDTAEVARQAYELIRDSGTATPREIAQAFEKAADAAEKSADRAAKSWAKAETERRKYISQEQQDNQPGVGPAPAPTPDTRPSGRPNTRTSSAATPQAPSSEDNEDYTQAEKDAIAEAEAAGDYLVAANLRRKADHRISVKRTRNGNDARRAENAERSQQALDKVKDLNTRGSDRDLLHDYGLTGRGQDSSQRGVQPAFQVFRHEFNFGGKRHVVDTNAAGNSALQEVIAELLRAKGTSS